MELANKVALPSHYRFPGMDDLIGHLPDLVNTVLDISAARFFCNREFIEWRRNVVVPEVDSKHGY